MSESRMRRLQWPRLSLYQVGTTAAKIGDNDNVTQAQEFLRTAFNLQRMLF
jgi:hypothetical protein